VFDLVCIGLTLLFFAAAWWLARGCQALEDEEE